LNNLTSRIRWLRKKRRGNDGLLKDGGGVEPGMRGKIKHLSYWVSPSGENNMRGLVKLLGSPTSQKVLYLSPHWKKRRGNDGLLKDGGGVEPGMRGKIKHLLGSWRSE
jgi:hypothetical protein